jgi:hypothetical protein
MYTAQSEKGWVSTNILTWEDGDGKGNTKIKLITKTKKWLRNLIFFSFFRKFTSPVQSRLVVTKCSVLKSATEKHGRTDAN